MIKLKYNDKEIDLEKEGISPIVDIGRKVITIYLRGEADVVDEYDIKDIVNSNPTSVIVNEYRFDLEKITAILSKGLLVIKLERKLI